MIGVELRGRSRGEDSVHAAIAGVACEIATRGMFAKLQELCGGPEEALETAKQIARHPAARARAEELAAAAVQGMLDALATMQLEELDPGPKPE